jgi:hypothetical protein
VRCSCRLSAISGGFENSPALSAPGTNRINGGVPEGRLVGATADPALKRRAIIRRPSGRGRKHSEVGWYPVGGVEDGSLKIRSEE